MVRQSTSFSAGIGIALFFRWIERKAPDEQEAVIGSSFIVAASVALLVLADSPHGAEELRHVLSRADPLRRLERHRRVRADLRAGHGAVARGSAHARGSRILHRVRPRRHRVGSARRRLRGVRKSHPSRAGRPRPHRLCPHACPCERHRGGGGGHCHLDARRPAGRPVPRGLLRGFRCGDTVAASRRRATKGRRGSRQRVPGLSRHDYGSPWIEGIRPRDAGRGLRYAPWRFPSSGSPISAKDSPRRTSSSGMSSDFRSPGMHRCRVLALSRRGRRGSGARHMTLYRATPVTRIATRGRADAG